MQKLNDKTDKVIIRHVTNAVPAGNLAVITGDGFKNARVFANNSEQVPILSKPHLRPARILKI